MADLERIRSDLRAFADAARCPLEAWQASSLDLATRTTAIVAPRQSGKSRSLAVLALWQAYRRPRSRVLIVSAGEEASRRLLGQVRRVAAGAPLLAGSVVDEQAGLVTLTNGSEVRSVPASERQVRGWTVDLLLVDEAAMVPDDLLLGAALPTTAARPEASVVLASSALLASGAFYDHVVRAEAGSEHVRAYRWSLDDCQWISPSVVAAARESMSALRFSAEYEGRFASAADALFSRAVLDNATADYLPDELDHMAGPARVLAGQDWGATTDRSALVAVGRLPGPERRFAVRCSKRWPAGHPLPDVIGEVVDSPAHFDTLVAETNGLGLPLSQELQARLGRRAEGAGGARPEPRMIAVLEEDLEEHLERQRRRVRPLPGTPPPFTTRALLAHTSAPMKAAAYSALRLLIERQRLLLPASATELIRELLLLRVDLTPTGERIEASSSGHDDLADALMLASCPYRSRRDGAWNVYLSQLADDRRRLPEPRLDGVDLERLSTVRTGGGVEVPRTPVWASVRGPEVTVPALAQREDPQAAWWRRQRESERRVRAANRA